MVLVDFQDLKVFILTFDHFNVSLLNKMINKKHFTNPKYLINNVSSINNCFYFIYISNLIFNLPQKKLFSKQQCIYRGENTPLPSSPLPPRLHFASAIISQINSMWRSPSVPCTKITACSTLNIQTHTSAHTPTHLIGPKARRCV